MYRAIYRAVRPALFTLPGRTDPSTLQPLFFCPCQNPPHTPKHPQNTPKTPPKHPQNTAMARPKKTASTSEPSPEPASPARGKHTRASPRSPVAPASPAKRPRGRPPRSPLRRRRAAQSPRQAGVALLVQKLAESGAAGAGAAGPVSADAILAADTPAKLAQLLQRLVATDQDRLFAQFRETSAQRAATDAQQIARLSASLEAKQNTIDALAQQAQELQNALAAAGDALPQAADSPAADTPQKRAAARHMYESPIRKKTADAWVHRSDVDDEFRTIAFSLDMLELLTGVRITNYVVDADRFLFDVKQSSTLSDHDTDVVTVEYQLLIQRDFQEKAEVTYVPVFLELLHNGAPDAELAARARDAARVRGHLPLYLQLSLNFPYNTLLQFYAKLNKALNKCSKA
ncbi:hypothetical protein METBIDRAFT_170970 [Metschnikowia bicuspidata var. bicuspidata NRRL YB-4993]|uniref:Monopolin complex subunit Csm1/Pcs1 C-terminal domain-containing protein n=1 Tax=Metschnikowia bicuspidata var. bicuspidata NRRL YB-4993 TaxID=869754 RepID=A0A1A0HAG3_9ASCO|nr:hypothetical protein METBIDRAFT_170970 [Metschnikowia bicuspidata var. bicuspidata NRRL YB-4993]OBA21001.1 hypothetical protein METBIDRAFT_170970 [Metschnikowia bicuspidata var. bicuspidata NRRL YB-4993]